MTTASSTIQRGTATAAPDAVVAVLESLDVTGAVGVADSQLAAVLERLADDTVVTFVLREDVAVAMAAGAALVGRPQAVFMKNAGIGTSLDALVSLGVGLDLPLVLVIGWAGTGADHLPHHVVMGDRTLALLSALDIDPLVVSADGNDIPDLVARAAACRADRRSCALLVVP